MSLLKEFSLAQSNPSNIRNICVIAHVDHGKTTLSDSLIASNGIISERLAGNIRYMDNRKDEQERQITMKSSNISLIFRTRTDENPYLVNLIDSPGHVDFGGEVSSAVRLADGALVVVDAVEGVCNQTHTVLRQAWKDQVQPCLVINKLDRLITELKLEPETAYLHLNRILESVNVIMATLYTEEAIHQEDHEEIDDSDVYFSPERGNVLFACAKFGWGFRIQHFAEMYSKRLKMNYETLLKTLWGEFYFSPKDKSIKKNSNNGKLHRMFVQFVLQNIWHLYNAVEEKSIEKVEKIVQVLGLKIPERELRVLKDEKGNTSSLLSLICRQWMPLSSAIIRMVIEKLPNPQQAQEKRYERLFRSLPPGSSDELIASYEDIKNSVKECRNGEADPVIVYVSKVFSSPNATESNNTVETGPRIFTPKARKTEKDLSETPREEEQPTEVVEEEEESESSSNQFIGFARIFSGVLKKGSSVWVLGPRYDPRHPESYATQMKVDDLYLMMGRGMESVEQVSAGTIFGISGIDNHILKTATISSSLSCCPLASVQFSQPIVRVAIEPKNPNEMPILMRGLKKLNQADASVEVFVQETGEQVISAAGEMHLERCLRDLMEMFAPIELEVSPPIVSFKETIVQAGKPVKFSTRGKLCSMTVTAVPLPTEIVSFFEENRVLIKEIFNSDSKPNKNPQFGDFQTKLMNCFMNAGREWFRDFEKIWSFGPKRSGPNILFNRIPEYSSSPYWKSQCSTEDPEIIPRWKDEHDDEHHGDVDPDHDGHSQNHQSTEESSSNTVQDQDHHEGDDDDDGGGDSSSWKDLSSEDQWKYALLQSLDFSITNGFQLATAAGPLCEEPLSGVAFFVEQFDILQVEDSKLNEYGPFKGQIMSSFSQALRQALDNSSPRIVEPFYQATVQFPSKWFGDATAVLCKRRATITLENFVMGTDLCIIEADLPVIESFGFAEEIMRKTSGAARTQLQFTHWGLLDEDPNWVPTTEEEVEEFGANVLAKGDNIARVLIDNVRRRKGLYIEEKLVEHADKQRTLSRNK